MIRKHDFITGERLLQSFPYILLDQNWIDSIKKQTLSLAEKAQHYFQKSNYKKSIREWQKKIINYLEHQQRLPFPLFRLVPAYEQFFSGKQSMQFQSARGELFALPLYFTEELAYLTGVVMGDGHIAEYFVNIIDASKKHIENLAKLFEELFQSKIEVFKQKNANAWNVNILGKWIVRYFNFISGQPINQRKYPALREPNLFALINDNSLRLRSAFWRGLMDADGGYKNSIVFGSASLQLVKDFVDFLTQHNIQFHPYHQKHPNAKSFQINIAGPSRQAFAQLVGSNHPEKKQELQILLARKVRKFSPRATTLFKQGIWKGQIYKVNPKALIEGYFDFSLIPHIKIAAIGSYIRNLRRSHSQKQVQLAQHLNLPPNVVSRYERNITAFPLPLLQTILTHYNLSLVTFLEQYSKLSFRSSTSTCQFPTHPNDTILSLLQGLQLKEHGYFLLIGLPQYTQEQYREKLANYFSICIPKSQRKLNNAILQDLVQTLFLIR